MADDSPVHLSRGDLVEMLDIEGRLKAAETMIEVQKSELVEVKGSLHEIGEKINQTLTNQATMQGEMKSLVNSLKDSATRNARDVAVTVAVATIIVQALALFFHI